MPRYLYQRGGGPLLSWKRAAPQQTRAADAKALGGYESFPGGQLLQVDGARVGQASGLGCGGCGLGSLAGSSLEGSSLGKPTLSMPLPRAGAPEPLPTLGAFDASPAKIAVVGMLAVIAYKALKKRR